MRLRAGGGGRAARGGGGGRESAFCQWCTAATLGDDGYGYYQCMSSPRACPILHPHTPTLGYTPCSAPSVNADNCRMRRGCNDATRLLIPLALLTSTTINTSRRSQHHHTYSQPLLTSPTHNRPCHPRLLLSTTSPPPQRSPDPSPRPAPSPRPSTTSLRLETLSLPVSEDILLGVSPFHSSTYHLCILTGKTRSC